MARKNWNNRFALLDFWERVGGIGVAVLLRMRARGFVLVIASISIALIVMSLSQRLLTENELVIDGGPQSPQPSRYKERHLQQQDTAELTHRDSHDEPSGEAVQYVWEGSDCFAGSELTNRKLVKECRDSSALVVPRIDPSGCEAIVAWSDMAIHRGGNGNQQKQQQPPPCGYYASGRFSPGFILPRSIRNLPATCNADINANIFKGPIPPAALAKMNFSPLDPEQQLRELTITGCEDSTFFSYLTPQEMVFILRKSSIELNGQGILFSGDSIVRQMMLRIVAHIRNQRTFSEHYFHVDGMYVLWKDHDELFVLDHAGIESHYDLIEKFYPGYNPKSLMRRRRKTAAAAGGPGGQSSAENVVLVMMFQWETQPSVFRKDIVQMPNVPLHVAAFMYWWDNKGHLSDVDEYMLTIETKHKEEHDFAAAAYFYVTTPWTDPGIFGGVDTDKRIARNSKMTQWVQQKLSAAKSQRTYGVVDFAGLAEVEHLNKTLDGIHYMCIWLPKVPELVRRQKYNYDRCRDHMNMAVVQWMAHALGHALDRG